MEYSVDRRACGKIRIIQQLDPKTEEVLNEFYTLRQASLKLFGTVYSFNDIRKACENGGMCKGYKWRYEQL